MKKFRLNPLFIPLAVILLFLGKGRLFFLSFLAVALHETAHSISARNRGYVINTLSLAPYGAVLGCDGGIADEDAFFIYIAGPASNIAVAFSLVSIWWLFPSTYSYTLDFFRVNLALGIYNLLPLFPLDGGRIVLSIAKNKKKALSILNIVSLTLAVICLVLFVVSAFYKISFSLFLVSLNLFVGVLFDGKKEKYVLAFNRDRLFADMTAPLTKRELYVHGSVKVKNLLKKLRRDEIYVVTVVDSRGKIKQVLTEEDLEKMFFGDRELTVDVYLSYLDRNSRSA